MPTTKTVISKSEQDTMRIGTSIADTLRNGDILLLSGALGAGKSLLARSIIRHLLHDKSAEVPSPTYTLVQPYDITESIELLHVDLYRITDPNELDELALFDDLDHTILIVEWPEKVEMTWPAHALHITLNTTNNNHREICLTTNHARWSSAINKVVI